MSAKKENQAETKQAELESKPLEQLFHLVFVNFIHVRSDNEDRIKLKSQEINT